MSRKDYIAMARLLHGQMDRFKSDRHFMAFVIAVCNFFAEDNHKFNSVKFIDAVYDEHWDKKPPPGEQSKLMEPE